MCIMVLDLNSIYIYIRVIYIHVYIYIYPHGIPKIAHENMLPLESIQAVTKGLAQAEASRNLHRESRAVFSSSKMEDFP